MTKQINKYVYIYKYIKSKPETEGKTPASKMRKISFAMTLQ